MSLDDFLCLTMRQLLGFLKIIDRANATSHYMQILAYAQATGAKLTVSLDEFLGVTLKEDVKAFDDEMDAKLEAHMRKVVEQKRNG